MAEIKIENGVVTSSVNVRVTRKELCDCGAVNTITLDLPEGMSIKDQINPNANCATCNKEIIILKQS
jgi:hypothetical protein